MKKFLKKKLGNEKGMTLIELLAVIVILAIIAAIAIPAIGNIIENSRHGAVKADYQNALAAANIYFTENDSATTVTVATMKGTFLDDPGSLLDAVVITKGTGGASNIISGSADIDGDTVADYTIPVAGATNAALSDMSSAVFGSTY